MTKKIILFSAVICLGLFTACNDLSSSKTAILFTSEKTILNDKFGVMAFYEENAISAVFSDLNGGYGVTYRLLNSLDGTQFVGWLWSNNYWSKNCEKDSIAFYNKCISLNGEFVDYNNGCQVKYLQVSCVYPTEFQDKVEKLNQLANEYLEYVKENWNEKKEIETESSRQESKLVSP